MAILQGKSFGAVFPPVFAHCMSLCLILAGLRMFQTFSLLIYLLQCSVMNDL